MLTQYVLNRAHENNKVNTHRKNLSGNYNLTHLMLPVLSMHMTELGNLHVTKGPKE